MQYSLGATALLMGLVGGPHCVAMCGAACVGIGQAAGVRKVSALWGFQIGRVLGYSCMGALAAASIQGLGWLTIQSAALRPVWTMFHVAALMLGLVLLLRAQQPAWLERAGRRVWLRAKAFGAGVSGVPVLLGTLWSLLPCGLLYSALLVAAMAGGPSDGALVMALFAVGTSIAMTAAPWLWLKLRGPGSVAGGSGAWGVRLAGLTLAASSGWGLWMGLLHNAAPWCATP